MLKKEVIIEKTSKILSEKPIIYIYQYNSVCSKNQRFLKSELSKIENVSALVIPNRRMHKLMAASLYSVTADNVHRAAINGMQNSSKTERVPIVKTNFSYQFNKRIRKENIKQDRETFNVRKNSIKTKNHLSAVTRIDFLQESTLTWYEIKKLFQGPSLLLGCNKLEELSSVLDVLKNYTNFLIIGGLFENQIITHLTSKKLIGFSKAETHQLEPPAMLELIHYLQTKACYFFLLKNSFYLLSLRLYSIKSQAV